MAKFDYNTVVVGAGFGRLCCAAVLAKSGHKVLVIEKGNSPGGHSATAKIGPYGFDLEASLIWGLDEGGVLHWLLEHLSALDDLLKGENAPRKLDPAYQMILPSGRLNVFNDKEALYAEFEREFPEDMETLAQIYGLAEEADVELYGGGWGHPFSRWRVKDGIRAKFGDLGLIAKLKELEMEKRSLLTNSGLSQAAKSYLDAHALFFGGYESFLDCPVSLAGAILSIAGRGIYSLRGSSEAMVRLIEGVFKRDGGEISYRVEPRQIIFKKGKAQGIMAAFEGFQVEIKCENIVAPCPTLSGDIDLFPRGPERDKALSPYADLGDGWQSRSAFIGLSEEALPELMAQNVIVYRGGYEELPGAEAMSLWVSPAWDEKRAPRGKRAITASVYKKKGSRLSSGELANWQMDNSIACAEVAIPFASKFIDEACIHDPIDAAFASPGLGAPAKVNPYLYCLAPNFCNPAKNLYFVQDSSFLGRSAAFAATSGLYAAELILKKY